MPQFRWRPCAKQWDSGTIKSELYLLELKQHTQNNAFITVLFLTDIRIWRIRHVSEHLKPFNRPFHTNTVTQFWWEWHAGYYETGAARGTVRTKRNPTTNHSWSWLCDYRPQRGPVTLVNRLTGRMKETESIPGGTKYFSLKLIEFFR